MVFSDRVTVGAVVSSSVMVIVSDCEPPLIAASAPDTPDIEITAVSLPS